MLGVFGINVYIGRYDTNLIQISPVHAEVNWLIAAADLLAVLFLLAKPRNLIFKTLGGIVWPMLYVATLLIDVETKMCLGATANTCLPSVSDAYQYLILGSASQDWDLWPYTIRLAIALVVLTLVLSLVSLNFRTPKVTEKAVPPSEPAPGTQPAGTTSNQ